MWAVVGNRGGGGPPRSRLVGAGDLLDQIDDSAAQLGVLDAHEGLGQRQREAGGTEALAHAADQAMVAGEVGLAPFEHDALANEPNAHYVLVSTREHGNSEGPVEFRSYRIVDGDVTEEDVDIEESRG